MNFKCNQNISPTLQKKVAKENFNDVQHLGGRVEIRPRQCLKSILWIELQKSIISSTEQNNSMHFRTFQNLSSARKPLRLCACSEIGSDSSHSLRDFPTKKRKYNNNKNTKNRAARKLAMSLPFFFILFFSL